MPSSSPSPVSSSGCARRPASCWTDPGFFQNSVTGSPAVPPFLTSGGATRVPEEPRSMTERTAGWRSGGGHPDGETLRDFIHGRLGKAAMAEVERHVAGCDVCCRAVQAVPDDRLIGLLRRREAVALMVTAV